MKAEIEYIDAHGNVSTEEVYDATLNIEGAAVIARSDYRVVVVPLQRLVKADLYDDE